jgi:hypothetical protein
MWQDTCRRAFAETLLPNVLLFDASCTTTIGDQTYCRLNLANIIQFTSALNKFLEEMYEAANPHKQPRKQSNGKPAWLTVQELAFKDDKKSVLELQRLVEHAERKSIKLPLVRIALKERTYTDDNGKQWKVEAGKTVILDIVSYPSPSSIGPRN